MIAPQDSDGDGVPDNFNGVVDACPLEDATGFDADVNGCIDSFSGLGDLLANLVTEGVIDGTMQNSLSSKVANAEQSADKDKICTAVNQLEAFKNQVAAQLGKKISAPAANLVTEYANNLIVLLEAQLPAGQPC